MNILIIGGAGFLGRNMNDILKDNHTVYCSDIITCDAYEHSLVSDVNNTDTIIEYINEKNIDNVVYAMHDFSIVNNDVEYVNQNLRPLIKLLDKIDKTNVKKFVYISSAGEVYGNTNVANSVNDKIHPITTYGTCKGMSEMWVRMKCLNLSIDYMIIRPSNPFGRLHNLESKRGFVNVACSKILNDEEIVVVNGNTTSRDFVPISLFKEMFQKLVESDKYNKTYNIGFGKSHTLNEVIKMVEEITGKKAIIKKVEDANVVNPKSCTF